MTFNREAERNRKSNSVKEKQILRRSWNISFAKIFVKLKKFGNKIHFARDTYLLIKMIWIVYVAQFTFHGQLSKIYFTEIASLAYNWTVKQNKLKG